MGNVYLRSFELPSDAQEIEFIKNQKRTCYNGIYPFKLFPPKELSKFCFGPVTILCGGNGSGKTTILNLIAEKLRLMRHSAFSGGAFFSTFVGMCSEAASEIPPASQYLSSDDVFDYMLNIRYLNDGIDVRREELFEDYLHRKYASHRLKSLKEYEDWKDSYDAKSKSKSQSQYVRERLMRNVDMHSNGESAMRYFVEHITENALYLLDEPENSLSVAMQRDLAKYISDSAMYFGCQFIIATHSPIMLSLPGATIYDLDETPVAKKPWTKIENVRAYFDFFEDHRAELLADDCPEDKAAEAEPDDSERLTAERFDAMSTKEKIETYVDFILPILKKNGIPQLPAVEKISALADDGPEEMRLKRIHSPLALAPWGFGQLLPAVSFSSCEFCNEQRNVLSV